MSDKNLDIAEHLKADVWGQHLHDIDLMNRAADENTARYLARFKEDTRRDEGIVKGNATGAAKRRAHPGSILDYREIT